MKELMGGFSAFAAISTLIHFISSQTGLKFLAKIKFISIIKKTEKDKIASILSCATQSLKKKTPTSLYMRSQDSTYLRFLIRANTFQAA